MVDKATMELWHPVMTRLMDINPTGIWNVSLLVKAFQEFDDKLGKPMSGEFIKENWKGEHLQTQAYKFKRLFMGLSKMRENVGSKARCPDWLKDLLNKLEGHGDREDPATKESTPAEPKRSRTLARHDTVRTLISYELQQFHYHSDN